MRRLAIQLMLTICALIADVTIETTESAFGRQVLMIRMVV